MKVYTEHLQVLKSLQHDGKLTAQAVKSIRGQLISMGTTEQREEYLQAVIRNIGKKNRTARVCDRKGGSQNDGAKQNTLL